MVKYDFRDWLKSLEGRSSAELFAEGIQACGAAIRNLSSDGSSERTSDFARRVAEFLFWVKNKGTVKPESVPEDDWQAYAGIARSLVERGEFSHEVLKSGRLPRPTRSEYAIAGPQKSAGGRPRVSQLGRQSASPNFEKWGVPVAKQRVHWPCSLRWYSRSTPPADENPALLHPISMRRIGISYRVGPLAYD
jgi:hypothetical protein